MAKESLQLCLWEIQEQASPEAAIDDFVDWAWERIKHLPKPLQIQIAIGLQIACTANHLTPNQRDVLAINLLKNQDAN